MLLPVIGFLLAVLAMTALVVALPVILPLAAASTALERRRMRRAVPYAPCTACGRVLGVEALALADTRRPAPVDGDGLKLRMLRTDAVCPACGTEHRWDDAARTFRASGTGTQADWFDQEVERGRAG